MTLAYKIALADAFALKTRQPAAALSNCKSSCGCSSFLLFLAFASFTF